MKWPRVFFCLLFCVMANGCAILVIGTAGVAGGYSISNDGIEGVKELKYEKVWKTAEAVLSQQGVIEKEAPKEGVIIAGISGSTVRFELKQTTPKSIVLRVRARRYANMFPNMQLAKRIYSMIVNEAK